MLKKARITFVDFSIFVYFSCVFLCEFFFLEESFQTFLRSAMFALRKSSSVEISVYLKAFNCLHACYMFVITRLKYDENVASNQFLTSCRPKSLILQFNNNSINFNKHIQYPSVVLDIIDNISRMLSQWASVYVCRNKFTSRQTIFNFVIFFLSICRSFDSHLNACVCKSI